MGRLILIGLMGILLSSCSFVPFTSDKIRQLKVNAEQGDPKAQHELGLEYCCGFGAGHDTTIALQWFCKSAIQGYGPAQYEVGRFYGLRMDTHDGESHRQELILAYAWYRLAAENSVPLAAAERDALLKDLSPQEVKTANNHIKLQEPMRCG
ncbi:hypothetical protein MNBD_GAMMA16-738 [hydrothermal vent metagenome]|uniref:Sel1 repeat family protein n=1 Tax=hydrothermal vent metagenome TaxID=652676 RepID=A0A3B0YTA0_9ZZZZ